MANSVDSGSKMKAHEKTGLIVCGTDTDVGKTVISALLMQGLGAKYWKPIQSGIEEGTDTERIRDLLELPSSRFEKEVYKFKAPVSPHWAAEKENQTINIKSLDLPVLNDFLIIETAGGLLVPITRNYLQIKLVKEWRLPVVLVARTGLGTINHTLLSIAALRRESIPLLGLILNGDPHEDNPRTIAEISNVEILGSLPKLKNLNKYTLAEEWKNQKLGCKFERMLKIES